MVVRPTDSRRAASSGVTSSWSLVMKDSVTGVSSRTITVLARRPLQGALGQGSSRQPLRESRSTFPPGVGLRKSPCARATIRVRPTRVRARSPPSSRECGSPDAIPHLRSGTPTRRRHPPGRGRSSDRCRRRDALAKRGSGRVGHGRAVEPSRQGCGGRGRPRWWRGAAAFAVAPTSGGRYGWSGIESWRNRAPTDSQHFSQQHSQQCSQTNSRHPVEGSPCSGNSQQHSQQHSQDYSQQHSQALVTAL
jgi:hypothetical protein